MDAIIHLINYGESPASNLNFMLDNINCEIKSYPSEKIFLKYYSSAPKEYKHECIILELAEDPTEGFDLIDELNQQKCIIPIIVVTAHPSFDNCRHVFKSGVLECFKKPLNSEQLINGIYQAFQRYEANLTHYQTYQHLKEKFNKLSNREKEVMDMILDGNTSKEAAQKLSLSPRTVEVHRSNMYTKLKIKSLPQLVQEYDFFKNYVSRI